MIQRIQSLYLLISAVLMALVSFLPLMHIFSEGTNFDVYALGIKEGNTTVLNTLPLFINTISAAALILIALFAFRKRLLQIRIIIFSAVLQLGSYGLGAYYILQLNSSEMAPLSTSMPAIFPLISIILCILAIISIGKDEALVKSLDRIR